MTRRLDRPYPVNEHGLPAFAEMTEEQRQTWCNEYRKSAMALAESTFEFGWRPYVDVVVNFDTEGKATLGAIADYRHYGGVVGVAMLPSNGPTPVADPWDFEQVEAVIADRLGVNRTREGSV